MAVSACISSSENSLRQEILVDGRHTIVVDEPERLGGTDTSATPYELLAASVAGCVMITLRMYARRKGWSLEGVRVEACLDRDDRPTSCKVTVELPEGMSEEQCARLRQVAKACPVSRTLACGIEFEHEAPQRAGSGGG